MNSRKNIKQNESLPIHKYKKEIVEKLNKNNILLVIGETGCGKTTQMPQILLSSCDDYNICITQPRKVAAISVSLRVANEVIFN